MWFATFVVDTWEGTYSYAELKKERFTFQLIIVAEG